MAQSLTTLRNSIQVSLFGRRLGLKKLVASDDASEALVGVEGIQATVTDATSDTTGTNIKGFGWTNVDTTTDDTWLLDNPIQGVHKFIFTGSTSTGIRTIKRKDNTFAIRTSGNSTGTTIAAQGGGLMLHLFGLSSALYGIVAKPGSTELAINGTT